MNHLHCLEFTSTWKVLPRLNMRQVAFHASSYLSTRPFFYPHPVVAWPPSGRVATIAVRKTLHLCWVAEKKLKRFRNIWESTAPWFPKHPGSGATGRVDQLNAGWHVAQFGICRGKVLYVCKFFFDFLACISLYIMSGHKYYKQVCL